MKVSELIEQLELLNPDDEVWMAGDPEGNYFRPYSGDISESAVAPDTYTRSFGETYLRKLTPDLEKMGYTEEDTIGYYYDEWKNIVVIWP